MILTVSQRKLLHLVNMKYLGGKLFILAISHNIALITHVPTMKKNMIEHYHLMNQFYI